MSYLKARINEIQSQYTSGYLRYRMLFPQRAYQQEVKCSDHTHHSPGYQTEKSILVPVLKKKKCFAHVTVDQVECQRHSTKKQQSMPYTQNQQIVWQLTRLPSAMALLCASAGTCSGLCPRQGLEWDGLSLSTTVPLFTGALNASSPGSTGIKLCPQWHLIQLNDGWKRDVKFTDPAILFLKYLNTYRWSTNYIQATGK